MLHSCREQLLRPRLRRYDERLDCLAVKNALVTEIQMGSTSDEHVLFAKPKLLVQHANFSIFNGVSGARVPASWVSSTSVFMRKRVPSACALRRSISQRSSAGCETFPPVECRPLKESYPSSDCTKLDEFSGPYYSCGSRCNPVDAADAVRKALERWHTIVRLDHKSNV
jgi:hypothetical protein